LTFPVAEALAGSVRRAAKREPLPPGFAALWTTVAIDLVGFGIVLPVLPLYARRYHATTLESTLLVAAFSAASLVFSPLWGRVSDRVGRRPVLVLSLLGTAAGSLLTGLAGGLVLLFVGRLVDGASGASVSVAQAAAGDLATEGQRARLFGLLGAAFGVGFVAGPALGALAALGGPRLPFLVAAAIAGGNALVAVRRLPETRPTIRPGGSSPLPGALRTPGVIPLVLVSFCTLTAFSAFESTLALFGHRYLGLTIASSAATFAVVGVLLVVVQGGAVHTVVTRFGEGPVLVAGLIADGAGLLVLAGARGWVLAAPALALLTVGQALVQTTMASTLAARADPGRRGQVLGVQQAASGLGRVAGPALGGALLGTAVSGDPYLAGAALIGASLAVLAVTRSPGPPVHSAPTDVTVE
jgi:DHA1 family tetracycline resistance protein-like MFS transporter